MGVACCAITLQTLADIVQWLDTTVDACFPPANELVLDAPRMLYIDSSCVISPVSVCGPAIITLNRCLSELAYISSHSPQFCDTFNPISSNPVDHTVNMTVLSTVSSSATSPSPVMVQSSTYSLEISNLPLNFCKHLFSSPRQSSFHVWSGCENGDNRIFTIFNVVWVTYSA